MKGKKSILVGMAVVSLCALAQSSAAATVVGTPVAVEAAETRAADIIQTKFRLYKGVLQYRRWNQTKGVWVDPEWINC